MIELLSITKDSDWQHVDRIQKLAYAPHLLEDLNVLEEKAGIDGHFCSLIKELDSNEVIGYVLAHPYPEDKIPSLNSSQLTSSNDEPCNVFLHDMALDPSCAGKGIGQAVITKLLARVKQQGYKSMTLVAVQSSEKFWNKAGGFEVMVPDNATSLEKYGSGAKMMRLVF
jgi:GNAT superfamily N-acetyltransferase